MATYEEDVTEVSGTVGVAVAVIVATEGVLDGGAVSDTPNYDVVQWFIESAAASDGVNLQSSMIGSLVSSSAANDVLVQALNQLVAESVTGDDALIAQIAVRVIEAAQVAGVPFSQSAMVAALAELVAAEAAMGQSLLEDVAESAVASDALVQLYKMYKAIIESAVASEAVTSYVLALETLTETSPATDTASAGQVLNYLVAEGVTVFVHLSIGGEVYTGWVLNTMTNAVTEYQGLQFNGLAQVGNRYFGTMEGGLYELTGSDDAGTAIATYIKTGLLDFADPQQQLFADSQKRVDALYLGCSAEGEVAVKVVTVDHGQVQERWYAVNAVTEGEKNTRLVLGKGLRSRRWMFEIASTELNSFSAVTLYPLQTGRRI